MYKQTDVLIGRCDVMVNRTEQDSQSHRRRRDKVQYVIMVATMCVVLSIRVEVSDIAVVAVGMLGSVADLTPCSASADADAVNSGKKRSRQRNSSKVAVRHI